MTDASAGALSLTDARDQLVRHQLLEWDGEGDTERSERLAESALDAAAVGRTRHDSLRGELSIPMRNHEGAVIGVLQLVRAGAFDVVKAALADEPGVQLVPVAVQPGKPQGLGRLPSGTPVWTLPGNPVSAFASFEMFVRPAVRRMLGAEPERPRVAAVADEGWRTPPGTGPRRTRRALRTTGR